jgi:hypothetical protein
VPKLRVLYRNLVALVRTPIQYSRRLILEGEHVYVELAESDSAREQARRNAGNENVLFVWIPKCAGNSIYSILQSAGGQKLLSEAEIQTHFQQRGIVTFGHISIQSLLTAGLLSRAYFESAWKFAVVRNPFDRTISLFEYLRSREEIPPTLPFRLFCEVIAERAYEPIGLYNRTLLNQLNSQHSWLIDEHGKLLVDDVFQFENLSVLRTALTERSIGNEGDEFPQLNPSRRQAKVESYFDARSAQLIRDAYAKDFELFEYDRELPGT